MTELLSKALQKASDLPDSLQDDLAQEILDEIEWLRSASANPAFDFLKDSKENIYTDADGKPFKL